jgi:hypothetical protein
MGSRSDNGCGLVIRSVVVVLFAVWIIRASFNWLAANVASIAFVVVVIGATIELGTLIAQLWERRQRRLESVAVAEAAVVARMPLRHRRLKLSRVQSSGGHHLLVD